jgi:AraC family transcriptional regulator of adaptative response / DNA-3-methyladenine glycosylase II
MLVREDSRYSAVLARDARFDGRFFIGVTSTGVFCNPSCPAAHEKRINCRFFATANEAIEAGFRACARCRPEISVGKLASQGTSRTIARALKLIDAGALDGNVIELLAGQLGVGQRHLRRLFVQHLGTSPNAIAQHRRLNLARELVIQTKASMAEVAFTAGFTSIRRFNTAIRGAYGTTPQKLRENDCESDQTSEATPIVLCLPFVKPYNVEFVLGHLRSLEIPGVEKVGTTSYRRTIEIDGAHGLVEIIFIEGRDYALASVTCPKLVHLQNIIARVRRMFDLATDSAAIAQYLDRHTSLGSIVHIDPGIRLPGAWDAFELAIRVLIARHTEDGGRLLVRRLVEGTAVAATTRFGASREYIFPRPSAIADARLTEMGLPPETAVAIRACAIKFPTWKFERAASDFEAAVHDLYEVTGLEESEARYVAMRSMVEPDTFTISNGDAPDEVFGSLTQLGTDAEPWRSYAALQLWPRPARRLRAHHFQISDKEMAISETWPHEQSNARLQ